MYRLVPGRAWPWSNYPVRPPTTRVVPARNAACLHAATGPENSSGQRATGGHVKMIKEFTDAVLDGIVENLPTALIMAGLAAATALVTRRRARKRKADSRGHDHDAVT